MRAQVTMLRHWKSEHSEETCEDASGENTANGLFAVADGAGTTLFSDAWAASLVRLFLRIPLLSGDPFETEWWVRLAQEQFKNEFPAMTDMSWNAQQKVQSQGSYTTLATLCFSACEASHARAELLVFGDSCVFASRPSEERIFSFPLQHAEEFERAPICIPSKAGVFNRYFHQCQVYSLDLFPADCIVLATDAVAKWIVSAGNGRYEHQKEALQEITRQTSGSWAAFIQECRARQEMVDDDSTALLILLQDDTAATGSPLGTTTEHSQPVREQRKQEFLQALKDENKERVAICFGDGQDLKTESVNIAQDDILLARQVADAQREVLAMLRQEVNNPNVVAILTPVWQKHVHLLYNEPCAANLRKTLTRLGVQIEPREPVATARSIAIQESAASDEIEMLHTRTFDVQEIQRRLQVDREGEEA
jgi:Protein phosphatase 2C